MEKQKILIIDDSDMNRALLIDILGKQYDVVEAENGAEAISILAKHRSDFSLLLLDIMMPEMDGIELLAAVKVNRDTSHIPVILLSAKASVDDRVRGLEYGADDYIAKPFNSAYLKARIESLIRQRSSLAAYYLGSSLKDSDKTEKKQPDVKLEQVLESVPSFNNTFIHVLFPFSLM